MKVLAVSTWCPYPADNGSRMRAFHLLAELSTRHEITLVTFTDSPMPAEIRARLGAIAARVEAVHGTPFVRGPLSPRGILSGTPRSLVQADHREMRRLVGSLAPIHDVAVGFQVNAALYLRQSDGPRVFEEAEAGMMGGWRLRARGFGRLRRELTWRKSARFMRRLATQFERTTVVSSVERGHLIGIGVEPSRIAVVPNGVDERDLMRPRPPTIERLIYPGALTYTANLDAVRGFLAASWPLIRGAVPDLEFVVTGSHDGVDLASLPNLEGVRFTGRVEDVKPIVAESAVVVVPLQLGGGTRLKILEAFALGTPVVATSKGAEGLVVTPEDDILIGDEPERFARQVLRVLESPELASHLSRRGRALVERTYTWKRAGAALNETLEEACEQRRGSAA